MTRGERLRVGVIGLGRLWEARHKTALTRLHNRFQITALYDQVAHRAVREAQALGCDAVEGLTALIARPDVDVVYLLTPQWFGLAPIEIACAHKKPIYCALPLASEPEHLDRIAAAIQASGAPFMPELARRFYPAALRLKELLATKLGRPRRVLGQSRLQNFDRYGPLGPAFQSTPAPLALDPGGYLLDWCRFVFEAEPSGLQGLTSDPDDFASATACFPDGGLAQVAILRYDPTSWGSAARILPQPGFQVFAQRGIAWLEMPDHIRWADRDEVHDERLPVEPTVGEQLNEQFYRLVQGEPSMAPTLDDALAIARWVATWQHQGRAALAPTPSSSF